MNVTAQAFDPTDAWNFKHLVVALFAGFVLQSLLLPCLCDIGTAKIVFAYAFDGLILFRIFVARACREKGKGWLFYVILCYTSPAWIEGAAYILLGRH